MKTRLAAMLAVGVISVCFALPVFADGSHGPDGSHGTNPDGSHGTNGVRDAGSWVGKRVMVKRWNVDFKIGSKVVGQARLGNMFTVSRVNGDWLWIKRVHGWIDRGDVVLNDQAIAYFTAEVKRSPTAETYHQRGLALASLGQYKQAIADFDSVIRSNPRNAVVYNDRGNALLKLGQIDRAIADFDKVLESEIRHPGVYTNRGLAWYHKQNYERALADFNAAIALDARFAPAWEAGGTVREAQGKFAKAIENFGRAIKSDPKFVRAHNNLAWILATCPDKQLRDGMQAIEHATTACELTQFHDSGYLDTLGAAYAEAGQFDKAVERATQALGLAPDSAKPGIARRLKLYKAGKPYHERSQKA